MRDTGYGIFVSAPASRSPNPGSRITTKEAGMKAFRVSTLTALFAAGIVLFIFIMGLNILANTLMRKK
jgi:ABC-type phosphate transport system permease subunit